MKSVALIEAFARSLGLPDSATRVGEEYQFVFDDTLEIRLLPEGEEAIVIYGALGPPPEDHESYSRLLRRLLKANIDSKMLAAGCVVSLDVGQGELVLHQRLASLDMSTGALSKAIEGYLNELESLKNTLMDESSHRAPSPFIMLP